MSPDHVMEATIAIREAEPQEIGIICDRMALIDPWKSLEITAEILAEAIAADALRRIIVAADGDELVGAVMFRSGDANAFMFHRNFGPILSEHWGRQWPCAAAELPPGGYVNALAVFPGRQGRGIGKALLYAAEAITAEESPRMYLSVSETNQGAKRLYETVGYRLIGRAENCLREGNTELLHIKALRMRRSGHVFGKQTG
jgi:ribosomal protein S18 acetylase RimI-like enzyme